MIRFRPWYLQAVGAAFVVTACALALKEIDLAAGYCLALGLALIAATVARIPLTFKPVALTAFSTIGAVAPILYFAGERSTPFLAAIATFFAAGVFLFFTQHKLAREPMARAAMWVSLFGGSLALIWATYFRVLTPLNEAFLARRLILTLFFIACGLVLLTAARGRRFWAAGGLAYVLVGIIKTLAYDTTHLSGALRIGVFAASGALLLIGAKLTEVPLAERDARLAQESSDAE